ncbi:MAG: SDR family oxidoreductase [Lachnospiraceae bacterium]
MMLKDMFSLKGKVTVITGGNQGIGKCVARYLADAGSDIVIFDLNDASAVAEEIAQEFQVRTAAFVCDVTNPSMVNDCISKAAEEMGTLDCLFNNAGISIHCDTIDAVPEDWLKVVDVNLNGIYHVAQAFGKYLITHDKTGNIVNTASMSASIVNIPQIQPSYNASKAAVIHLTKSLAVEWASKGIRVNCISPGYMNTEMTARETKELKDLWISKIPFERMGEPDELAGAVIYLLSDASTYTSGLDMIVDGCYTLI